MKQKKSSEAHARNPFDQNERVGVLSWKRKSVGPGIHDDDEDWGRSEVRDLYS